MTDDDSLLEPLSIKMGKHHRGHTVEHCRTCAAWRPMPAEAQVSDMPTKGTCHFNPPVPYPVDANNVRLLRPIVWEGDFCLQHHPIPEPPEYQGPTSDASRN